MAVALSRSAIKKIFHGVDVHEPVLQVLKFRKVENGRYRVQLSDGDFMTASALFSTQSNELVENGEIDLFAVIKIHRYMLNKVNETKKIIIILEASVVVMGKYVETQIGEPVLFDGLSTAQISNGSSRTTVDEPSAASGSSNTSTRPSEKRPGVYHIAALTPYQNKWTICARVTSKSDIRTWSNSRGEGKLFSVNLLDSSGEIRATAFTEEVDRLHSIFEENKLYYITGGSLKPANKKYSTLKNDYELNFNSGTTVSPCHDDTDIPKMQFEFVSIDQLEKIDNNEIVDIIGVCKTCEDVSTVQQRSTGRELKKRDVQVIDNSNSEIRLTLWGSQAENFEGSSNPVVAIKGVRVSDYHGKSLSVLSSSVVQINPDIKEAHKIRAWFDNVGMSSTAKNLSGSSFGSGGGGMGSNFKCLGEAVAENIGSSGEAEYYSTKAVVNFIRQENCMYQACPGDGCNKKVVDLSNGMYRCEKCNRDFDNFKWRLLISASLCDATDNMWVTVFQDQAEALLDCKADELATFKDNDSDAYSEVFHKAIFREFIFKLRVKMDTYMDERRLKTTVVSITPLDPVDYTKFLQTDIQKMLN